MRVMSYIDQSGANTSRFPKLPLLLTITCHTPKERASGLTALDKCDHVFMG